MVQGTDSEEILLNDMVFQGKRLVPYLRLIYFAYVSDAITDAGDYTEDMFAVDLNIAEEFPAATSGFTVGCSACRARIGRSQQGVIRSMERWSRHLRLVWWFRGGVPPTWPAC